MLRNIKRTLRNGLTESITIHTGNQKNIGNLSDVLDSIESKLKKYLIELIGEKQYHNYKTGDFISYDGTSNPYDTTGTLNFYTWNLPTKLINHIVKMLTKFITQNNMEVNMSNIQKSESRNSNVIRVIITQNNNQENKDLNLSNANARFLFTQIINYTKQEYQQAIDRGYFNVGELKTKVEIASTTIDPSDFADANRNVTNYDMKGVENRLNAIKELVTYCEDNEITQLVIQ